MNTAPRLQKYVLDVHQNKFQIAITTPIGKKTTGDHRLFIMFHLSYHGSKYISVCKLLHNHSRNGLEVEEYVCNYTSLSERCLISSKKGYPLPDPTTIKIFLSKRPISKYTKGRTFITKPGNPRCCRHNTNL